MSQFVAINFPNFYAVATVVFNVNHSLTSGKRPFLIYVVYYLFITKHFYFGMFWQVMVFHTPTAGLSQQRIGIKIFTQQTVQRYSKEPGGIMHVMIQI